MVDPMEGMGMDDGQDDEDVDQMPDVMQGDQENQMMGADMNG